MKKCPDCGNTLAIYCRDLFPPDTDMLVDHDVAYYVCEKCGYEIQCQHGEFLDDVKEDNKEEE